MVKADCSLASSPETHRHTEVVTFYILSHGCCKCSAMSYCTEPLQYKCYMCIYITYCVVQCVYNFTQVKLLLYKAPL